jgi:hypothetical protein
LIRNLGVDRAQVAAIQPDGKRDLRTADRNDATRVFGLIDTAIGIASAIDPKVMGGPLQPRAPTYVARSWGSRSTGNLDVGPQSSSPTSYRRAPCGACPIGAGRAASQVFARLRIGLIGYLRTTTILARCAKPVGTSPARLRISALLASLKVRIRRPGLPQVREEIIGTRAVGWIVGHTKGSCTDGSVSR